MVRGVVRDNRLGRTSFSHRASSKVYGFLDNAGWR